MSFGVGRVFSSVLSLSVFVCGIAAQAEGMFTPEEIRAHQQNIDTVTSTASKCLQRTYDTHVAFFKEWQVSKYYGDRNPALKTRELREAQLRSFGKPVSLESELEPISCVGLTVKCLGEGFAAAGEQATWEKIITRMKIDNKMYGTDLQKMLHELGWKVLYWNPDPSSNVKWDKEDRAMNPAKPGQSWNPVWGGHALHYNSVMKKNVYFGIPVDDKTTLVGYGTTVPASFQRAPFFVGIAHAGYHVFPGSFGRVIEGHSMRKLNSIDNLEVNPFNPLSPSGAPKWTRSEKYRSGVVAIPPTRQ